MRRSIKQKVQKKPEAKIFLLFFAQRVSPFYSYECFNQAMYLCSEMGNSWWRKTTKWYILGLLTTKNIWHFKMPPSLWLKDICQQITRKVENRYTTFFLIVNTLPPSLLILLNAWGCGIYLLSRAIRWVLKYCGIKKRHKFVVISCIFECELNTRLT